MEIVIVTGMSGAGKSIAIASLEDFGFYCVDNMPPELISKFAEICSGAEQIYSRLAIVTDVRGGKLFYELLPQIELLKEKKINYKLLFLDSSDSVLLLRYKETRRKHPLIDSVSTLEEAISKERNMMSFLREQADYVIDTSVLAVSQLKERMGSIFMKEAKNGMLINFTSFGFKYGASIESDLVFDVRCLPNPFYIEDLKRKTGLDQEVKDYVLSFEQSKILLQKLTDLLEFLIPLYKNEGKSQVVISLGCTGGKHRSVTFSEMLYKHFNEKGENVSVNHRDIKK